MKKRLTQAEFEHAISNLSRALKPANVEIVKAILVDGRKQNDMVIETGLSRTAIVAMTKKVREAHKLHGKPPAGWERIELCIPSSMVPMLRAMEDEARKQANAKGEMNEYHNSDESEGRGR